MSATNLGADEADRKAEYFLGAAVDFARCLIKRFGNFNPVLIDHRMVAPFGEDIDEDGGRQRIVEQRIFGVDVSPS